MIRNQKQTTLCKKFKDYSENTQQKAKVYKILLDLLIKAKSS